MAQRKRTHTQLGGHCIDASGSTSTLTQAGPAAKQEQQQQLLSSGPPFFPPSDLTLNSICADSKEQPRAKRRLNEDGTELTSGAAGTASFTGIDTMPPPPTVKQEKSEEQREVSSKYESAGDENTNRRRPIDNELGTAVGYNQDTEMKDGAPSSMVASSSVSPQTMMMVASPYVEVRLESNMAPARPTPVSFTKVMVDLCMAKVLQFSGRHDRMKFTRVSKWWRRSVHHHSAWTNDTFSVGDRLQAPIWLCSCIVRLEIETKRYGFPPATFLDLTQLRSLRLSKVTLATDMNQVLTVGQIRTAFQRLKLEELILYELTDSKIWSILFLPLARVASLKDVGSDSDIEIIEDDDDDDDDACDPVVWSWCETLEKLKIDNYLSTIHTNNHPPLRSVFHTLCQRVWSKLKHFEWSIRNQHVFGSVRDLNNLLTSSSLPSLEVLDLCIDARTSQSNPPVEENLIPLFEGMMNADLPELKSLLVDFSINGVGWVPLPRWFSITVLDMEALGESCQLSRFINIRHLHIVKQYEGTTIGLFEAIGYHSMPHLDHVTIPTLATLDIAQDDTNKEVLKANMKRIRAIMSKMVALKILRIHFQRQSTPEVLRYSWIKFIPVLPSLTDLHLNRYQIHNQVLALPRNTKFVSTIASMSSLERFEIHHELILSMSDISALALCWALRTKCHINAISLRLPLRHDDPIEKSETSATIMSLSHLPHLTDLTILRRPEREGLSLGVTRFAINEHSIASSYFSQLSRLRHLKRLDLDDYYDTMTWNVLDKWTCSSATTAATAAGDAFPHLTSLRIAIVKDCTAATISCLARLPQLHTVLFVDTKPASNIVADEFEAAVGRIVRTINQAGRQPRLEFKFEGKEDKMMEEEEEEAEDEEM